MAKNPECEMCFLLYINKNSLSEAHVRIKQTTNVYNCVDT